MPSTSVVANYIHQRFKVPLNISSLLDLPLEIAAIGFKPITDVRNSLFDHGILKQKKLKRCVISIGNITIGGSGKTPLVQWLSKELSNLGIESVVLSRGYRPGKPSIKTPRLVDPLNSEAVELFGDESVLLAKSTKSRVVVCRDRFLGGKLAEDQLSPSLFILDDGFQFRSLYRNLDVVVIDVSKDIDTKLFPRGVLREGWRSLNRANLIILSKSNLATPRRVEKWINHIKKFNSSAPLIDMTYKFGESRKVKLESLRGEKIYVVAGIADPESFSRMLLSLNANIVGSQIFRDHYLFNQDVILKCEEEAERRGAKYIITTEKDGIRLTGLKKRLPWVELPLCVEIDRTNIFSIMRQYGVPCDTKS